MQRPERGVPKLADLASITRIIEEPGTQASPVFEAAAPAPLDLDFSSAQGGQPFISPVDAAEDLAGERPEAEQALLDLRREERDVLGDRLGVVEAVVP